MSQLSASEIESLDPYAFMAVIGKRVIHPGGRRSTAELFQRAGFQAGQRILDVGCGVGTSAIQIARAFGCSVTAVDIATLMLERAQANVRAAGLNGQVTVKQGDILALEFPDNSFDHVLAEAVTMFVDRFRAAKELIRVCRPGGQVLATEFLWRKPPTSEAKQIFQGEICPGMNFDSLDDWVQIYRAAGLDNLQVTSGPFEMMTMGGFLADEGFTSSMKIMAQTLTHPAYLKKMAWLMPRMSRAVPYLGYIAISGTKPTR